MAGLSDIIEHFLLSTIGDEEKITISRNGLAEHFACSPSQINYVLSTRFNTNRGYIVESKRGGNGCITVIRIKSDSNDYLTSLINELSGYPLSQNKMQSILIKLVRDNVLSEKESSLIFALLCDKSYIVASEYREINRSVAFKNMLLELIK